MNPHPSYQTAPLAEYRNDLRDRAISLFQLVEQRLPANRVREYKGSFSMFAEPSFATAAKIVIYEPAQGSFNGPNPPTDGVYIFIRVPGGAAANTLAVAPHHDERFAYFRLTDGQDLEEMADFITACSNRALL